MSVPVTAMMIAGRHTMVVVNGAPGWAAVAAGIHSFLIDRTAAVIAMAVDSK